MTVRAGVVGASGYMGAELLRLLAGHPEIDVAVATGESKAGARVADLYPSLTAAYGDTVLEAFDPAALAGLDLVFCALPHGESQKQMGALTAAVPHVIDVGADFRLPAATYEQWYGEAHQAPELLAQFSFGLVELFRKEILDRPHVANPGCYPTASSLALAPLVGAGLIEPTGIVVNAMSGVSGRGRGLSTISLFSEANENAQAYGLLTHRHTAEIELALSAVAPAGTGPVQVLFTPHLVPMTRGIVATCTARPAVSGLSTTSLLAHLREFWVDEPFVLVGDGPPAAKSAFGSNAVHVTARFDERTGTVLALAAEDNLVKGGSGQAVQNANVLLGFPETTGLSTLGVFP
jgi:N-acetyl-gamma-glutamyl-phosphate reductase